MLARDVLPLVGQWPVVAPPGVVMVDAEAYAVLRLGADVEAALSEAGPWAP